VWYILFFIVLFAFYFKSNHCYMSRSHEHLFTDMIMFEHPICPIVDLSVILWWISREQWCRFDIEHWLS